jgi:SARP family transcriptional regulator, regulator of embCAB operon
VTDAIARDTVVGLPRALHPVRYDDATAPRFSLLGPLQIRKDDRDHAPTAPELRQLLALLLMRPGHLVHPEVVVHEIWPEQAPPQGVRTGVHTLVRQLRECIDATCPGASGRHLLAVRPTGYLLRVEPDRIDTVVFRQLAGQGRKAFHARQFEPAARLLRSALALWSGPPLADVPCGPVLSAYRAELREQLRTTRYLRIQAEIEAGRAEELIGELRALVAADPLDEGAHAQLMQVLGSVGRRAEALALYRQLRERLVEELGLEPCETLQQLRHDVLRAGLTVPPPAGAQISVNSKVRGLAGPLPGHSFRQQVE